MPPMPAKTPAPMPADDDADSAAGAGGDDTGVDFQDDSGDQVLCTVLKTADGGYKLVAGDEDDGDAGGGGEAPAGGDAMGDDMGAPEKPEGQTFSEPGQLLKGILDLLNKDAEASGGTNQSHFESGFGGDGAPTPKKAMPPKM